MDAFGLYDEWICIIDADEFTLSIDSIAVLFIEASSMANEGCNGLRDIIEFGVAPGAVGMVVVAGTDEDINARPDIDWFGGGWGG